MFRKILLMFCAIVLLLVSKSLFLEIAASGCVQAKFGLLLCDWTKYVWAASPAFLGLICIWAVLRNNKKMENN